MAMLTGPWHKSRTVAGWQLLAEGRGPAPAWLRAPTAGAGPPPMPEQHLAPSTPRTHGIIESFRLEKIHKIIKAKHHLTLLSLLLNHVPKHNLQGWQFHHFPEQPAPMPNHSFHEEIPLVSNPTLHWNNSKPLPRVLSLTTHDKRPAVQGHITVIVALAQTPGTVCTTAQRTADPAWKHGFTLMHSRGIIWRWLQNEPTALMEPTLPGLAGAVGRTKSWLCYWDGASWLG